MNLAFIFEKGCCCIQFVDQRVGEYYVVFDGEESPPQGGRPFAAVRVTNNLESFLCKTAGVSGKG